MIALDTIVFELLGVVKGVRNQLLDDGLECSGEIGDDLVGFPVNQECSTEERSGCFEVASG